MTTVYKVVRRRKDGQLASAIARRRRALRLYAQGKETRALNGTKLLALESKTAAERFVDSNPCIEPAEIWQAEAINPVRQGQVSAMWSWEGIRAFWKGDPLYAMSAPPGTVACDSITLMKRVDGGV